MSNRKHIRFDWAIKRILQDKASIAQTLKFEAEEEVRRQRDIEIAKALKKNGVPIETIVASTSLSSAEIEAL